MYGYHWIAIDPQDGTVASCPAAVSATVSPELPLMWLVPKMACTFYVKHKLWERCFQKLRPAETPTLPNVPFVLREKGWKRWVTFVSDGQELEQHAHCRHWRHWRHCYPLRCHGSTPSPFEGRPSGRRGRSCLLRDFGWFWMALAIDSAVQNKIKQKITKTYSY